MKEANKKGHTLYDSKHMIFWKKKNYENNKKNNQQLLEVGEKAAKVRFKFTLVPPASPTNKSRLYLDDVKIL